MNVIQYTNLSYYPNAVAATVDHEDDDHDCGPVDDDDVFHSWSLY